MTRKDLLRIPALGLLTVGLTACSATHATVEIKDIARQAVLYEPARAPHLKGPELRVGQSLLAGNYHLSLSPNADGLRAGSERAPGGVAATHSWDLRFSTALGGESKKTAQPVWEFGVNLGLTHPELGNAQAASVQIARFEDIYVRAGLGFRGPIYHNQGFSLGIVLEGDFAALPYSVDVVRNTQQSITKIQANWFSHDVTLSGSESSVVDTQHLTGHTFFPTFRGGLYGAYYFNDRFSVTFGATLQNTPAVSGLAQQEYTCKYEQVGLAGSIPDDVAAACRHDYGESFPLIEHALAGSLHGGVHVIFDPLVLTLRLESHLAFVDDNAYAAPISGDLELAWLF